MTDETSANCIFCRITRGEAPAHIAHADERIVAFLDINPTGPAISRSCRASMSPISTICRLTWLPR
jgi:hypothetical protein